MAKKKRKLTAAERAARKRRHAEFMTVFINGKQKRVRRPPTFDGLPEDEFLRRNTDPVWLVQNGYFELLEPAPAAVNDTTEPLFLRDAAEPENSGQTQSAAAPAATDVSPEPCEGEFPF